MTEAGVAGDRDGAAPSGAPVLAIDLGATNLRCGLVASDGRVLVREQMPTPVAPALAEAMARLARRVRGAIAVPYAVVGVPGRVDYAAGALAWGRGQPPEYRVILTEAALGRSLGIPVWLANDADLATCGEARFGAGAGRRHVAYLTISSGLGAGALVDGRLLRGRVKLLELGLTVLGMPTDAAREEPTLLEDLASGSGLEAASARAGLALSAEGVVAAVRGGDLTAARVWTAYTRAVGAAVVDLAHLLVPEVIVIGGGVSRAGDLLVAPVRGWLDRYGPQGLPEPIDLRVAALADDAGLAGAAAWREVAGALA